MFGQLKENILYNLALVKNNPEELKTKFATFTEELKHNPHLQTLSDLYEMVEKAHYENQSLAKDFVDEIIREAKELPIDYDFRKRNGFPKLDALAAGGKAKPSIAVRALDKLLFTENLTVKDKFDQKSILIKSLTDKSQKPDFKEMITHLDKKVTTQVGKLTKEQKEALEVFLENNQTEITNYFSNLIESTITKVEDKIVLTESTEVAVTLVKAKKELQKLLSQVPDINVVNNVLELKSGLDA